MRERYADKKMGVESEVTASTDVMMLPENTLV
jgi:hypothetical protein